ncbi:hypothetical protein [Microbacterium sp. nov. GSS16]|uniref:hypothetical protein n=1 Tax=Microbacterium sp. nov. GSS16 TaxID=3019890 RepID=UPI0023055C7E|nr:hypothetical protein [Microbacterium sp. nov. GSS16]WCD91946.1 hypothetical protein PGB26_09675 [Microbacterium sp. nov. GSS16]
MSNPTPNMLPEDPDLGEEEGTPTREVDGEVELDPDADADRIDSIDADRLASGAEGADDAWAGDERVD